MATAQSRWDDPAFVATLEDQWSDGKDAGIGLILKDHASRFDVSGKTVLDVGCGVGRLAKFFREANWIGVDSSPVMVKKTRAMITLRRKARANDGKYRARFDDVKSGSVYAIPFPDAFGDLVICNAVLFHLGDPFTAFRELWRVTRHRLIVSLYWQWWPLHRGAFPVLIENTKAGKSWWGTNNRIPRWMITRLVKKKLRPKSARFVWTKNVDQGPTNAVYCILDKAEEPSPE